MALAERLNACNVTWTACDVPFFYDISTRPVSGSFKKAPLLQ